MALMKCKYQLCCGYLTSHFCGEPTNGGGGVCGEVCHSICMDSYYKERNFISSDSRCFECAPNEDDGDKDDQVEEVETEADKDDEAQSDLRYLSLFELLRIDPALGPKADEFRPAVESGTDTFGWCNSGCQNYKFLSKADRQSHNSMIHHLRADNKSKPGISPNKSNKSSNSGVVKVSAIRCNWKDKMTGKSCGKCFSSKHYLAKHKQYERHKMGRGKAHLKLGLAEEGSSDSSFEGGNGSGSDDDFSGSGDGRGNASGGKAQTSRSKAAAEEDNNNDEEEEEEEDEVRSATLLVV